MIFPINIPSLEIRLVTLVEKPRLKQTVFKKKKEECLFHTWTDKAS